MSSSRIEVRGRARQLLPRAHAPLGAPSTTAPKTESAPALVESRAAEKDAARAQDAEDVRLGIRTAEQVNRDNSLASKLELRRFRMLPSTTAPITPSLDDALAAAERSERRVEQWPAWMRELST